MSSHTTSKIFVIGGVSCDFAPSQSSSAPFVTCRFVSGLDGVKS